MTYNLADFGETVLDHYENPRNVGEIEDADAVATASNPACGDETKLWLRIRGGVIEEARFRTYGCVAAIAASSMTTELIRGKRLEEAAAITNRTVAEALGGLPPAKLHCSVLAEQVLKAAISGYRPGGGAAWAPPAGPESGQRARPRRARP